MDQVIEDTGVCGFFQVWIVMATYICPFLPYAFATTFMSFGSYNPGWTCVRNENTSHFLSSSTSMSPESNASNVFLDGRNSREQNNSSTAENVSVSATCGSMNLCEAVEFQGEASTIVTEWGLVCDKDWIPSFILSIQMTGMLVGALVVGEIGDRCGRKTALFGSISLLFLASATAIFSTSWQIFAGFRFFIGIGLAGGFSTSGVYPFEFLKNNWRVNMIAVPAWNVFTTLAASLVWLLRDWRRLHIAGAVSALVAFLPIFCTPESLRWSAVHGKTKQVSATTRMMARMNRTSEPPEEVMQQLQVNALNAFKVRSSYLSLLKADMWKITIRVCSLWTCMIFMYYVLYFGVKALSGNFYLNFILLSSLGIVEGCIASPLTHLLGRTRASGLLYFISALDMLAIVAMDYFLPADQAGPIITGLALTASVLLEATWSILNVITVEQFPTVMRAHATSLAGTAARVGGILAPIIIPRDSGSLLVPFAVMSGLSIYSCGIALSLPETRNKVLEDILQEEASQTADKYRMKEYAEKEEQMETILNA